jgi:hypothetical protein
MSRRVRNPNMRVAALGNGVIQRAYRDMLVVLGMKPTARELRA